MSMFVDRDEELKILDERYTTIKSQFLIMYGRRRVGKTELLKHFYKQKPHVYYLCTKANDLEQMKSIARRIADFFNERPPEILSWEAFFSYLSEKAAKKRFTLVIDEYPYLLSANQAISSIF